MLTARQDLSRLLLRKLRQLRKTDEEGLQQRASHRQTLLRAFTFFLRADAQMPLC